jgi:hypothetical protein
MKRLKNRADTRLSITPDILQRIVSILPGICFNMYENKLFKAAFTLAYWGLLRVGEITNIRTTCYFAFETHSRYVRFCCIR